MFCDELVGRRRRERDTGSMTTVDFSRFRRLHPWGSRLIHSWFDQAWESRNCTAEQSFEPFIYAWMAFNGWAACVTEVDIDSQWRKILMHDELLQNRFATLASDPASPIATHGTHFRRYWPIFEVQTIRSLRRHQHDIELQRPGERSEIVAYYLRKGVQNYDPGCWRRHESAGEEVPLDWPHTLTALYRVRCNLFHGDKSRHSEMDQHIVASAFQVMVHFLPESFAVH